MVSHQPPKGDDIRLVVAISRHVNHIEQPQVSKDSEISRYRLHLRGRS
ncbi:hypothetical protein SXIM_00420 [Streptomyces xiamenensis]|uniref:Uncharacterized protein n=1 Tax=Streptomyces xiamenensis TaxID=408015 RepID=A0A0F7CMM6_9ACTN|nr:hypothetical protein SXIM_00420 [Streptomyces xiamenensis]